MFHRSSFILLCLLLAFSATCRHDPEAAKQAALARGNAYFAQRKFAEASVEYRKAIREDARFGEAHYRLGLTREQLGDRPTSLREFGNAAALMPDRRDVQLKAGTYNLFASRFDEARKIAERLLDRNVRDVEAQLLLASALAGLDDLDAAARQVEEALRVEPSNIAGYSSLAAVELARGHADRAEAAFKNALSIAPSSIDARIGLASLYWSGGRLADAERLLDEAVRINPKHLLANRTLAALYLTTGRADKAEAPLQAIAAANPEFVAPRLALADYYLSVRRVDEGLKILESVAGRPDGATPASLRLAQYDFTHERRSEAYARVDRVIRADPRNPQPYLLKAAFLLAEHEPDKAIVPARAAVAASPGLARAQFAVGTIETERRNLDAGRRAFLEALRVSPRFGPAALELAKLDYSAGQLDSAMQFAETAVASLPQSVDARSVLVTVALARGDTERAGRELVPLQARYGGLPRVQALVGQQALQSRDPTTARKAFEQALRASPTSDDGLAGLVAIDLETGRKAEARRLVESRLALTPNDPVALALAGRVYDSLGLDSRSEETWKALVAAQPGQLEAYLALGRLYYRQKRLDQAVAETRGLVDRQPTSAGAQTMLGFLLEMEGRVDEAQQRYQKALELDPHEAAAANNLAWLYATRSGNLDVALQLAQTAKASLPDAPEVNDTLGWIYLRKGLRDLAVGPLEHAVSRMPGKATYHYHLGLAYVATNDWAKARASLERALAVDPNFDGAADARRVLGTVR